MITKPRFKIFGKTALSALLLCSGWLAASAQTQSDGANGCEVILLERVMDQGQPGAATLVSYRPANDFLDSVYDDQPGIAHEMDGQPIRGLLCTRPSVIPTLRDFPILATGVPLSLSQDFDRPDSALMMLYYKDGQFQHSYKGPDLSSADQAALIDIMGIFNMQPHDLD